MVFNKEIAEAINWQSALLGLHPAEMQHVWKSITEFDENGRLRTTFTVDDVPVIKATIVKQLPGGCADVMLELWKASNVEARQN